MPKKKTDPPATDTGQAFEAARERLDETRAALHKIGRAKTLPSLVAEIATLEAEAAFTKAAHNHARALDAEAVAAGDIEAIAADPAAAIADVRRVAEEAAELRRRADALDKEASARLFAGFDAANRIGKRRSADGLPKPHFPSPTYASLAHATLRVAKVAEWVSSLERAATLDSEALARQVDPIKHRIAQLGADERRLRLAEETRLREEEERREQRAAEDAREEKRRAQADRDRAKAAEEWHAKRKAIRREQDELIAANRRREGL